MSDAAADAGPLWVTVLLDWQNIYGCARDAFGLTESPKVEGNVYPLKLARQLAGGTDPENGRPRQLQEVRIYRGRPDGAKERSWYKAWQSQTAAWASECGSLLIPRYRDLRERDGVWIEKGVDVSLAIDLVSIAFGEEADRVVAVSSDTDLEPALELATRLRGAGFAEVAGWVGDHDSAALLGVEGVRQHPLGKTDYERLRDLSDYNLSLRVRRRAGTGGWSEQIAAEGKRRRDP